MALYIRNEETERLARKLAERIGTNLTQALTLALRGQLDRTPEPQAVSAIDDLRNFVRNLQAQSATDPILDARHPDAILYDDLGLPH